MLFRRLTVLVGLVLLYQLVLGQGDKSNKDEVYIRHLSVKDGLANRLVSSILKDKDGLVWLCTSVGISRFDNNEFVNFSKQNGLRFSRYNGLMEDKYGRIWCYIIKGNIENGAYIAQFDADIIDKKTEKISPFRTFFKDAQLPKQRIRAIEKRDQKIFVIFADGAAYEFEDDWRLIEKIQLAPNESISMQSDNYITTHRSDAGLKLLQHRWQEKKPVRAFDFATLGKVLDFELIHSAHFTHSVAAFFVVEDQPKAIQILYLDNGWKPHVIPLPTDMFNEYIRFFRYKNRLWVMSGNRFLYIDLKTQAITQVSEQLVGWQKQSPDVNFVTENEDGSIWLATNDGVYMFNFKKNPFRNFLQSPEKQISTRGIVRYGNDLYVTSYAGNFKIDLKTGKTMPIFKNFFSTSGLTMTDAQTLCFPLEYGFLWLNLDKFKPVLMTTPTVSHQFVFAYQGRLFDSNFEGLQELKDGQSVPIAFRNRTKNAAAILRSSAVYHVHPNKKGLWLATSKGLFLYNPTNDALQFYPDIGRGWAENIELRHIHEDAEGCLWIASQGRGVLKWQPDGGAFQIFTTAEGLSSNFIYAIYGDAYGYLWFSSDYGLMRFHRKTNQTNVYLPEDGIPHEEFNTYSHFQDTAGNLYFGGLNGVTTFHPKDFLKNHNTDLPNLIVTKLTVVERATMKPQSRFTAFQEASKIVLAPSDYGFTLKVSLPDYQNSSPVYAFFLEDYDQNWQYRKENSYTAVNLPYGTYQLRIKGRGANGQWSAEMVVEVVVVRPFFRKWWFYGLCIALIGVGIYGFILYRTYQLKKEKANLEAEVQKRTAQIEKDKTTIEAQARELQALDEVKSRFFSNVTHELRTPLTLILNPLEELITEHDLPDIARHKLNLMKSNSQTLLKLVEELLDLSRLEANKLFLEETEVLIVPLLNRLFNTFQSYAAFKQINFQLDFEVKSDSPIWLDEGKFEKIFNNLIANALKYTLSGGTVAVAFIEHDQSFDLIVSDTGIGISKEDLPYIFERYYQAKQPTMQGGMGIGLALCNEYAKLFKGSLKATSELEQGSQFTFSFPKNMVEQPHSATTFAAAVPPPTGISDGAASKDYSKLSTPVILLAEDNLEMQRYIKSLLEPSYTVWAAQNGKIALAFLQNPTRLPDLILSDYMMPEIDGMQLLSQLRQDLKYDIPFILLTAKTQETDKIEALGLGVDDYLTKPFSKTELLSRIENLIKNYQNRKNTLAADWAVASLNSADKEWLQLIEKTVKHHLSDPDFNTFVLAEKLNMTDRNLRLKFKKITGLSPGVYIKEARLQKAHLLLENRTYETIAEVCFAVGFQKNAYFSKIFQERFGKSPSEMLR